MRVESKVGQYKATQDIRTDTMYACVHVYLSWCRKGQHGVQLKELHESGHELVVGDHLHQALAVCLALVGEHA